MRSQVILVVLEDPDIREKVRVLLQGEGYSVLEAATGEHALSQINDAVDLVILGNILPGLSGIKVCEELRKVSAVPVLFLSGKATESDKLIGLMAGGDDYLSEPFSYAELVARVKAQLRRYCVYRGKKQGMKPDVDQILTSGRIKIALNRNEVWKDGKALELTETEYKILLLMIQHPQFIFSTHNIYESVWEESYTYSSNSTIMVHIRNLRAKLEDDPQNPIFIRNVWGKGYRFDTERMTR